MYSFDKGRLKRRCHPEGWKVRARKPHQKRRLQREGQRRRRPKSGTYNEQEENKVDDSTDRRQQTSLDGHYVGEKRREEKTGTGQ